MAERYTKKSLANMAAGKTQPIQQILVQQAKKGKRPLPKKVKTGPKKNGQF